jgi:Protein of unknown function (DUF1592)/Protein of unknown function (DUF1588)/Protein of unknown function (DUF1595)/Protein of unknown function (DUF1585)/Protein of unknown function (DUF1587)
VIRLPRPPSGALSRNLLGVLAMASLLSCSSGSSDPVKASPPTDTSGDTSSAPTPAATGDVQACAAPEPGTAPLRRLSNFEYQNTLADLTGDPALAERAARQLVREPTSLGFRNSASALTIPQLIAEQYVQIALDVAHQAMDVPGWFPCSLETIDRECMQQFVESFGKRAYRRPLNRDELVRFSALYNTAIEKEGDYRKAVEWVVSSMLSSSQFLFRVELDPQTGAVGRPSGYEMAQRLSYLLWQTMPDEALFAAAESGELDAGDGVLQQAKRMLADPKAYRVYEFFEQWLDLDELESLTRDPVAYPEFTPELQARFRSETKAFVYDLLSHGGTLEDLFSAEYTFADATLAAHYGLPTTNLGTTFDKVAAPGRSGILTQARLLVHDHPASSSIVRRGLKVRTDLLCQIIPAPPADVDVTPPVIDGTVTQKQRLAEHRSEDSCKGCHALMDPVGEIFEDFDALGRKRTTDEKGGAIEVGGELTGTRDANGTYASAVELGRALASSQDVRECVLRQAFRFFYGRELGTADKCAAEQVMTGFASRNYRLDDLILHLTLSDQFLYRSSEVDPQSEEATP